MDRTEFKELLAEALEDIAPEFSLDVDETGQLIVLTGLKEDAESDELVSVEPFDEEDESLFD